MYRVTLVVEYLGWVDYDFGHSTNCPVLLGLGTGWSTGQGEVTLKRRVNPTKAIDHLSHPVLGSHLDHVWQLLTMMAKIICPGLRELALAVMTYYHAT